jgi:uncharacterized membrane protein
MSAEDAPLLRQEEHSAQNSINIGEQTSDSAPQPRINVKERLVSLDALRGLTVATMIFVDFLGNWIYPSVVNHSTWDGTTLADFGS